MQSIFYLIDNCLFYEIMNNNGIIATFPKYPENKTMVLLNMAKITPYGLYNFGVVLFAWNTGFCI